MSLATARMLEVFPVPGGPWNKRCGNFFVSINFFTVSIISVCEIISSSEFGLYFSTNGRISQFSLDQSSCWLLTGYFK